jgi:hypothetical protein
MFGQKLELMARQCCVCKRMIALRVDPDDTDRMKHGVVPCSAFVDSNGKPYLSPGSRELFISECCKDCWSLLCPSDPLEYN